MDVLHKEKVQLAHGLFSITAYYNKGEDMFKAIYDRVTVVVANALRRVFPSMVMVRSSKSLW